MWLRALALAAALASTGFAHGDTPAPFEVFDASYPEGPLWQGDTLYFAEMGADRIIAVEHGERRIFFRQPGCGPTAIAPYGEGFLVLCHIGARVVGVNAEGHVARTWRDDTNRRRLRDPNDASADGHGGVYFTDPGFFARETRPEGYVMHLSADGALRRVAGPLWYPNGIYVDQGRGHVYVSEHMTGRILRYQAQSDGALRRREVFVDVDRLDLPNRYDTPYEETGPDGLEIGPNGDLFVAIYGAGQIVRISPEGDLRGVIDTAPRYITNIAFNGAGDAAITGPFENLQAPYPGEVRFLPASSLTRRAD